MSIRRIRAFYRLLDRIQDRHVVARFDAAVERQSLSRAQLERYAAERLTELLDAARREVPFYASRLDGVTPADPEAYRAIPPLEKADLAGRSGELVRPGGDVSGITTVTSGGTTGPPTAIALDRGVLDAHTGAALRTYLWWGADPTRRHALLWGPPPDENTYVSLRGRMNAVVLRRTVLPTYGMDAVTARAHWGALQKGRWNHLAGYSSALVALARVAEGAAPRVRAGVAAAAEPLFGFQRAYVEAAFGCPVIERYGSNEFASIAHECAAGSLHVAIDRVLLEIVRADGTAVAPGEVGRVLVTDLDNHHMPLIRYRIGDLAEWGPDCACGLPFPVLARVHGRERDLLEDGNGRPLTPAMLADALVGTPAREFQIAVDAKRRVRAIRVAAEPFAVDAARESWSERLGHGEFDVEFVERVERSRSGKILPVIEVDV